MSVSVASRPERTMSVLRYIDVVIVVVFAPIMLLIGVSAVGYLVGAGAWILLRVIGEGVQRAATSTQDANRQIAIRMGYMLGRLFGLALAVILVRRADGQGAGLAALVVVVFAFTVHLATAAITRPRSSR